MTDQLEALAIKLYQSRQEHKEAHDKLVAYRIEYGGCINQDAIDACYRRRNWPLSEWCQSCRDSQPLWQAYRHAANKAGKALTSLLRACKRSTQ